MNTATTIAQLREAPGQAPTAGLPDWLNARCSAADEVFTRLPFPHRRQEAWRYTPVDKLLAQPFLPAPAIDAPELERITRQLAPATGWRLVFVNGRYLPTASTLDELPDGVTLSSLHQAITQAIEQPPVRPPAHQDPRLGEWLSRVPADRLHSFSALNSSRLEDGLYLHLAPGCRLDQAIEVLHLTTTGEVATMTHPRNLVVLESGARATLIEQHIGADDGAGSGLTPATPSFDNSVSEILLEAGATLTHHRLQQEAASAYQLHTLFVTQQRDSHYQSSLFALGSGWSRNEIAIDFIGAGADCDLSGLFTVADQQLNDLHLNLEHRVPDCRSRVDFKGILHGKGRGVFDGRILVETGAQQTRAQLNNANLILERSAEIDTKPLLEIHANDVQCSHGATVGQLDPDQVFYLRSRGIDETQARRMLALGFAAQVIGRCENEALRARVATALAGKLDARKLDAGPTSP